MKAANTSGTASLVVGRLARAVGLLILLTVSACAYLGLSDSAVSAQATVPEFTNHLVDNANVIPDDAENQVNAELADYQNRSKNQIAILTVKTTDPQSIEDFAVDVGNKWGVGSKDQDNGVLMILAMDDRKGRVEVGYGLQGQLTDIASRDILDQHVFPRLKAGNPGEAVVAGERAIRSALGDTNVEAPVPVGNSNNSEQDNNSLWWLPFLFIAPPIVLGMFGGRKRRANGFGNGGWTYWGGGLGGGGLGGGGLGGGGFGGGGGGGFGGGGSSGSW